jgi:hypothetical protein
MVPIERLIATSSLFLSTLFVFTVGCGGKSNTPPVAVPVEYPSPTKKAGMTWYKDVLPIVQNHCQGCHNMDGIAPFPLLTYEDGQAHALVMTSATQERRMPPWMPAADCQSFKDARLLSQDQVDTIFSWKDDNAPAGNPADAPTGPPPQAGLSWVDRTLAPTGAYSPNPGVSDDYHCFVLDPALAMDQTLIGFDFVPGVRSEVHHVLVYSASLSALQAKDAATAEVGYTCFGGPDVNPTQLIAAWVPGSSATEFPTGTGIPIRQGSGIVVQIHYNLSNGGAQPDLSSLKLQFARQPILRPATITPLSQMSFNIPAGSTGYNASNSLTTPGPLTVWGVAPHMHTLGRRAYVEATPPGGESTCYIDIPKWDFHWQQMYFYSNPTGLQIPKDTKVTLTCTWDNPSPSNIRWGESTSDEMCITYFYVTQ